MDDNKKTRFSLSFSQILTIVMPLVIVAVYIGFSMSLIINNVLQTYVTASAESANEKVEYEARMEFESASVALGAMADAVEEGMSLSEIGHILKAFAPHYPQCSSLYYATAASRREGGTIITHDDWKAPADFEHTARDWFTGAVAAKGMIYPGAPYVSQADKTLSIAFSQAVYDSRKQLLGVAGMDLTLSKLAQMVAGVKLSPNTKACIVDQNGLFLTHTDASAILSKSYFEESKLNTKKYSKETFFDGKAKAFVQGDYFFAVRHFGETPWFIVTEGPMSDFTGTVRMWFNIIILIVAVLIFGCLVFYGFIINKSAEKERKVSERLVAETQNLAVSSKETAATAQDQSAAVKEIVATMEDNTALSEDISQKIKDVSGVANKTSGDVAEGVTFLEANVRQLHEIAETNQNTISGIKALGDKINNIWDIVSLINSVADQAKIIAFNAELEASSAGEAGKNFHIVATEIRRLADGIIDGTKEIKERINEIQQSSDNLVLASESGTDKIKAGVEEAKNLEARFASIRNASEVTATSAGDITTIIQQQAMASEQILVTLRQIASGVENFTGATEHISKVSQVLKEIATELSNQKNTNRGGEKEA